MSKLSIIVPVYNSEKYIGEAIESLLAQKTYDFEIVLVDDGSTDRSGAICDDYAAKHPDIIYVVHKENGGPQSARQEGVRIAAGEYIGFLDGDDWCDPDYYFNMMEVIREQACDVVCCGLTFTYQSEAKNRVLSDAVSPGIYEGEQLIQLKSKLLYMPPYYRYGILPNLVTKVAKAELVKERIFNVPVSLNFAEDAASVYPMLFDADKIAVLDQNNGYYYRQNPSSTTHAYDPLRIHNIITAMEFFEKEFAPYYENFGTQIDLYFTTLIKEGVKNETRSRQSFREKKERILQLTNKSYVQRAVKNMEDVPFLYRLYFYLFRKKQIALLLVLVSLLHWIKGKDT